MINKSSPKQLCGFGEINFGKQHRQGNRVYDSEEVAMALNSQPVGNIGGNSYLYLVVQKCGDRDKEGGYTVHDYSNCIPANPMSDRGQMVIEINKNDT